jgi:hypothetical protein
MEDDDAPKKTPRATIIRRAIVVVLALACAFGWLYTRYLVKKGTLGEACSYDMHCRTEAPRCLKPSADEEGVCSRSCETDGDCADKIRCIKVELDEYDDRGRPLEGGYCFPQALLDARKKRARRGPDAGADAATTADSWLDVPEAPSQLEAEITLDRAGAKTVVEVKGSLLRVRTKHGRTIVDTATLRVYTVDDEKKTFSASQLASSPTDARVVKTDRKESVAGQACEIWQVEEIGHAPREACVVKGAAFIDPTARSAAPLERELAVRGAFPLRVTDGGRVVLSVANVDAHPMAASSFAIPKSYKNLAAH